MNAFVNASIATLYSKPQIGVAIDEAIYGMPVKIIEHDLKNEFVKIKTFYNYIGWTHKKNLIITPQAYEANKIVAIKYLDIMAEPKVQSNCIQCVVKGSYLKAVGEPNDDMWQKIVLINGEIGYAKYNYLQNLVIYNTTKKINPEQELELRNNICNTAMEYLGTQYRWGGKTPLGIDCSGLASMAYLINGIIIHRDSNFDGHFNVKKIEFAFAKKGDLLFFPGHIALYLGDEKFIHATSSKNSHGVMINSFDASESIFRGDLYNLMYTVGTIF